MQLHDGLELVVGGVKVIAAANNKLQLVLGTDLFALAGTKLREVIMQAKKDVRSIIVEVGLQDSSELSRLLLKMDASQTTIKSTVYTTMEEPKVVIVPKCDTKVDSARLLVNPADFKIVDK